jgi:DNA-binding winged helix-turn-helix (wHTH) protein
MAREMQMLMASESQMPLSNAYNGPALKELRSMIRDVMGTLDDTNDKLGRIEKYLKDLEIFIAAQSDWIPVPPSSPIANNLSIQPRFDDSLAVSINGGEEFILGPRLAGVFVFLASGDADCGDGDELIAWRSREAILKSLTYFSGNKLRISYVNNLISLLKDKLEEKHYDRKLIQTHRKMGYRLALKRRNARSLKEDFSAAWKQVNGGILY